MAGLNLQKKEKIAIFIDGCFWHKCPIHYMAPKTNKSLWSKKVTKNIERDKKVKRQEGDCQINVHGFLDNLALHLATGCISRYVVQGA